MAKKKILIVDDEPSMREILKEILLENNFETIQAKNGQEALEKYKELKPDLVTLDLIMPGTDGWQTLENILAHDPKAKVIMVTAMYKPEHIEEMYEAGAKGYVTKPYHEEHFISVINKVLSKD